MNLTDRQLLLWLEHQLAPRAAANNVVVSVRFRPQTADAFDIRRLAEAFARVVSGSDALRTVFTIVEGEPHQHVLPPESFAEPLAFVDLANGPDGDPEVVFQRWFDERRARPL